MEKKIPKLRFPEFDGEWVEKKLGEVAVKKSSNIAANKIEENFGKYIIYGASGILKKVDFFEEEHDYISIVKDGAGVGRILYCKGKSSVLGTLDIIKPNKSIDTYFLYCLLNNIDFTKYITGSTIPHIYFKDYKNEECGIPSIPEQTKIANFLSAVDDKITRLKKKKELLVQYKKGVMQKIFSQELRFKDENGEDFAEWEEKKIKEMFRFKQGVQCGVENQYSEKCDNMERFIRIIDLTSTNEPIRYINSPGIEHHIKPDDLFMVRYGTPGLVGYGYEGIIANNLFRIIPVKKVVNKFYYFVFIFLSQELSSLASSSTMPALSFGSLEVLSIPEPSLPEQTKIANFLSAVDDKISHCGVQIEKMEVWKRGLLQQLFV